MKNYKRALLSLGILMISSWILINYAYKKEVPVSEKTAVFSGEISDFINANIVENSVIILKASVTAVRDKELELGSVISVQYLESENQSFRDVEKGDLILLKGIYLGYDDLFEEYKLINCILLDDE
ncbi:hypothetical protein N9V81_00720 [Flavobacteriaceae bacterium]|nr:hypothetical protein [Flavobacteriaceae bacterium]MDC1179689.1 hypothetical protein [Flavobacteriaceae bacterium]